MSGKHRAIQETNKARVGVAAVLTAGALLAPMTVAIIGAGVANAARPGGGTGDPGGPAGGGTDGSDPTGGGGDVPGGGGDTAHKNIIRLPGLKIEIKNTRGDHRPPTIKFVPAPCPTRR